MLSTEFFTQHAERWTYHAENIKFLPNADSENKNNFWKKKKNNNNGYQYHDEHMIWLV